MSRIALVLAIFGLSGCMVYAPNVIRYVEVIQTQDTQNTEVVQDHRTTAPPPPAIAVQTPIVAPSSGCPPFELPEPEPMPVPPNVHLMQSLEAIDRLLVTAIKDLRTHIEEERKRLEQAHAMWQKRCR
jgi:hypothetical protein